MSRWLIKHFLDLQVLITTLVPDKQGVLIPYQASLTNFLIGYENFARRIVSPDKVTPNKIIKICLNDFFPS